MSSHPFVANIIGIPHIPAIRLVNVRNGAGINHEKIAEVPVGASNLQVIAVEGDVEGRGLNGKQYQWFKVVLPNGDHGWVRDDLISVVGDGKRFGYSVISSPIVAFNLMRATPQPVITPVGEREPEPDTSPETDVPTPEDREPVQPEEPASDATAFIECRMLGGANLRGGAGTNHQIVGRLSYLDKCEIVDAADATDNIPIFRWLKIKHGNSQAWIREDLVRLSGGFGRFGITHMDRYPSPAPQSHWIRDFDEHGEYISRHHGWDLAGAVGAEIIAGPRGGFVVESKSCANCGDAGASVQEKGLMLNAPAVFTPGWNFGYGHYVIIRYTHDLLPQSTRDELARIGRSGQHLFVMYAHLHKQLVNAGETVSSNQQIAQLGNSGNSSGPHLHLEVRAGSNADETMWARLRPGLLNPKILFLR